MRQPPATRATPRPLSPPHQVAALPAHQPHRQHRQRRQRIAQQRKGAGALAVLGIRELPQPEHHLRVCDSAQARGIGFEQNPQQLRQLGQNP